MKKKIIFVTTNRSEFGIIRNILYKFDNSKRFDSTLLVGGSHLNFDMIVHFGNACFSEKYHENRGYCCQSKCKHCPYGFSK